MNDLKDNLKKIHTTELGIVRIKKNLGLKNNDIVNWCKNQIKISSNIIKKGKNWYVYMEDMEIIVNVKSYTIITAHKIKNKQEKNDKNIVLPKTKEELYGTYILKNDLINICDKYNLPKTGSKEYLLEIICAFIENRPVKKMKIKKNIQNNGFTPSLDKIIDVNYSNNEIHRAFFLKTIGNHFKFNVTFMNWMEKNKGKKTYKDALEIYNKILLDKKSGKKVSIGKQFEYNQYTRDFFEDNPNLSREDCIKCWNYK